MTLAEVKEELDRRGIVHDIEPKPPEYVWRYCVWIAKSGQTHVDGGGPGTSTAHCFYVIRPDDILSEALSRRALPERQLLAPLTLRSAA